MSAALIDQIKTLQRNDPKAKEQWHAYAQAQGGGVKDPAKHDDAFMQTFLDQFSSGVLLDVKPSLSDELVDLIKIGQKTSKNWRNCWQMYCQMNGHDLSDPAKKGREFIMQFLEFAAQSSMMPVVPTGKGKGGKGVMPVGNMAMVPMGMDGMGMMPMGMGMDGMGMKGMGKGKGMMMGGGWGMGMDMMGGKGGYGGKGGPYGGTGDRRKDKLVERIKTYQRSSADAKEAWATYCDAHSDGKRDPARLDNKILQEFCDSYGVP
eukprot:TRINITY_DN9202_c0_g1_i1.p1 TRINITY_DN9202_c0_g1~~TRINITY_DN9202_c0_g1_i1.p1  ORF type:complete len:262 (-),score=68.38 TRINITY_DN9202_c0_g1_i1:87-872(-)